MAADDVKGTRTNLPCALLFAAGLVVAFVGAPLTEVVGSRAPYAVIALAVVLAPVALVWVVGEAHLRWSPRGRVARGVVGWTLVLACLAVLGVVAPVGLYLLVLSLGLLFGW